jgi:hypothetical protein
MVLNGLSSFSSARMMSHFIVVSKGQIPWTAKPEDFETIMRDAETVPPTEADFMLYNSMLVSAALLVVFGLVFLGYAKCAKRASKANSLCQVKFNLCKSIIGFMIFMLAYGSMRHQTHKVMHIAEMLANNETIPAYHYKTPPMHPPHHKHGKGHDHHGDDSPQEAGQGWHGHHGEGSHHDDQGFHGHHGDGPHHQDGHGWHDGKGYHGNGHRNLEQFEITFGPMREDDPNLEEMFKQMDEMDKMFDFEFAQSQEDFDDMFAAMDE